MKLDIAHKTFTLYLKSHHAVFAMSSFQKVNTLLSMELRGKQNYNIEFLPMASMENRMNTITYWYFGMNSFQSWCDFVCVVVGVKSVWNGLICRNRHISSEKFVCFITLK